MENIRSEYQSTPLNEGDLLDNPVQLAEKWINDAIAKELPLPNAMTLATVDSTGLPSSRTVLLKGIQKQCFEFYTHKQSLKGKQLLANPKAAITIFWKELNRQINIRGTISDLDDAQCDAYFSSRPRGSQISAAISPQSDVVSKDWLHSQWRLLEQDNKNREIKRPKHWGGYALKPCQIEFWQGQPDRLHDRFLYMEQSNGTWLIHRLAP